MRTLLGPCFLYFLFFFALVTRRYDVIKKTLMQITEHFFVLSSYEEKGLSVIQNKLSYLWSWFALCGYKAVVYSVGIRKIRLICSPPFSFDAFDLG